jgi:hypothetical protein
LAAIALLDWMDWHLTLDRTIFCATIKLCGSISSKIIVPQPDA